ncbi:glycosyltransferase [Methanoculleus sp. YWC-01]|uniref:Glycosyltransferase n=1 Tax=Methanoculleus nereidis TaxID=2735141 RepID=A0ABU3Z2J2_9EURY|nr:glycosyltransferase [Methanoculleus sp. YWC-01]MDV4343035.1 glycosyltransferase [Methanoculleus sp. YWC-01]
MSDHFISVIVAVKNEEEHIEKCLLSLIRQNYPKGSYRIVVVDGRSADQTTHVVNEYRSRYGDFIHLYHNPKEWQAAGRNLAIEKEEQSDLIAYIDGHCIAEENWLRNLSDVLLHSDVDVAGVGSIIESPSDESGLGRAIDRIFSTKLGAAGTSYIPRKELTVVDTVPFVLYRKEALFKVGLYDEEMKYGEDYSLNFKLRRAGYRLLVNPNAKVYYYKRKSVTEFYNQMYNYGLTKAILGQKYPTSLKCIHYLPSLSLIVLLSFSFLGVIIKEAFYTLGFIIAAYFCLLYLTSIYFSVKERDWNYIISIPAAYLVEHIGYSVGFIIGFRKQGWIE